MWHLTVVFSPVLSTVQLTLTIMPPHPNKINKYKMLVTPGIVTRCGLVLFPAQPKVLRVLNSI